MALLTGRGEGRIVQTAAQPRYRHRIPCSLSVCGRQHSALVLNVSEGGLFVRTTALARPGDTVEVELPIAGLSDKVGLRANVVWRRVAHSAVRQVSEGGLGLRIAKPPVEYTNFLGDLATASPGEVAAEVAQASPSTPAPPEAAAPPQRSTAEMEFEIRMKQLGGPRSRSLRITAEDEADARATGLAQIGAGWEILEVRRRIR